MKQAACSYCGAAILGSAYTCLRCGAAQSVPLSSFNPRTALESAESPEIRDLRVELERVTQERDDYRLAASAEAERADELAEERDRWIADYNDLHELSGKYASDADALRARLEALVDWLKQESSNAYVAGCQALYKTECLGREYKMAKGEFGAAEFDAHKKANDFLARHFALADALKEAKDALK